MEIFARQGAPPVSATLAVNLPPVPLVVDTNGNLSPVNYTGGKFATGVNDIDGAP